MKVLEIANTAIDLAAQEVPFLPNYTTVIANLTGGALTLQESDSSGSGFTTLASLPAGSFTSVTFDKQYVKLSTSATVYALGN